MKNISIIIFIIISININTKAQVSFNHDIGIGYMMTLPQEYQYQQKQRLVSGDTTVTNVDASIIIKSPVLFYTPRINVAITHNSSVSISSELAIGAQLGTQGSVSNYITISTPVLISYNFGHASKKIGDKRNRSKSADNSFGWYAGAGFGRAHMANESKGDYANQTVVDNEAKGLYFASGFRKRVGGTSIGVAAGYLYSFIERGDISKLQLTDAQKDLRISKDIFYLRVFFTLGNFWKRSGENVRSGRI